MFKVNVMYHVMKVHAKIDMVMFYIREAVPKCSTILGAVAHSSTICI